MHTIKGLILAVTLSAAASGVLAAEPPKALVYQQPPAPISAMLDAAPTPTVNLSRDKHTLAVFGRESLPSAAALARPILRIGGYRIDPRTNGPAEIRMNWLTSLAFEDVATGTSHPVALPAGARFAEPVWSPNGKHLAFLMRTPMGLEPWVATPGGGAHRLATGVRANGAFGMNRAFQWLPDSSGLLVAAVPAARSTPPAALEAPVGPTVQESAGKSAAIRTYEDLLANPHDEDLFDYYFTSQLTHVPLTGGPVHAVGKPGLFIEYSVSPDGKYVQLERLKRPFSYLVPAARFPAELAVWTIQGEPVKTIADRPLTDTLPAAFDAVTPFPREAEWRADAPSTLVWVVAQDGGDSDRKVERHDALMMQAAPFTAKPTTLAELKDRFARVIWGTDDTALVITRRIRNRRETWLVIDPAGHAAPRTLVERNYQDQYKNPGQPLLAPGPFGRAVLEIKDGAVTMTGEGAARDGDHPFLAALDLKTGQSHTLWQAKDPYYETVVAKLDEGHILTRRESRDEAPNYEVRTLADNSARALTHFTDPEPQFAKVQKQLITYSRADGVGMSGTLYLPAGYDQKRDGPLPMLMWAYPTEFTDAAVAGQVVDRTKNRFSRPQGISPLFLVTQGYAVLDGPSFPIIGEGGKEPNDTYIEQLTADAKAAVDAVVEMGVTDRDHIAVGGHSYGAFMTANLLAHTDLFRAGIARSGAYNRTLTPFGFQNEQRTYWQAQSTYDHMSPFNYATSIKAPILLIHGEADDNSGTFPIQSERFYAALKGAGATVRYVTLPNEPHGYRGRESTGHVLWEMTNWLDRFVKHAPPRTAAKPST